MCSDRTQPFALMTICIKFASKLNKKRTHMNIKRDTGIIYDTLRWKHSLAIFGKDFFCAMLHCNSIKCLWDSCVSAKKRDQSQGVCKRKIKFKTFLLWNILFIMMHNTRTYSNKYILEKKVLEKHFMHSKNVNFFLKCWTFNCSVHN